MSRAPWIVTWTGSNFTHLLSRYIPTKQNEAHEHTKDGQLLSQTLWRVYETENVTEDRSISRWGNQTTFFQIFRETKSATGFSRLWLQTDFCTSKRTQENFQTGQVWSERIPQLCKCPIWLFVTRTKVSTQIKTRFCEIRTRTRLVLQATFHDVHKARRIYSASKMCLHVQVAKISAKHVTNAFACMVLALPWIYTTFPFIRQWEKKGEIMINYWRSKWRVKRKKVPDNILIPWSLRVLCLCRHWVLVLRLSRATSSHGLFTSQAKLEKSQKCKFDNMLLSLMYVKSHQW